MTGLHLWMRIIHLVDPLLQILDIEHEAWSNWDFPFFHFPPATYILKKKGKFEYNIYLYLLTTTEEYLRKNWEKSSNPRCQEKSGEVRQTFWHLRITLLKSNLQNLNFTTKQQKTSTKWKFFKFAPMEFSKDFMQLGRKGSPFLCC